ncbi:uncharacterized protein LOC116940946 isoform X1 [Petromyzon marinus]|uniref:uncharacterized protein LOC116940946 isoform X1 n=1 Tax=Petromyzon marinus TaxID=7757 RepID=UPI003F6EB2A6
MIAGAKFCHTPSRMALWEPPCANKVILFQFFFGFHSNHVHVRHRNGKGLICGELQSSSHSLSVLQVEIIIIIDGPVLHISDSKKQRQSGWIFHLCPFCGDGHTRWLLSAALDRHGGEEDRGRALTVRAVGVPDVDSRVTDAAETFANLQAEHMGVARARQDLCKSACCGSAASQHGLAECLRNLELRHETALKMELKGYNFSLVMKDGGVDMPTSVQEAARLVSELSTRARAFLGMSTRLDEMMAALLRTESTISKEVTETNRDYADNVRAHDNMQRSLAELRRGRKDVARYKQEINSLLLQVAQIAGVMEQASED